MASSDSPATVTVFRSRLRPEAAALGYHELADEMERRARTTPGFVEFPAQKLGCQKPPYTTPCLHFARILTSTGQIKVVHRHQET